MRPWLELSRKIKIYGIKSDSTRNNRAYFVATIVFVAVVVVFVAAVVVFVFAFVAFVVVAKIK
jgi:uncharacterized membrane protein YjgN (DUF898 family)